MFQNLYKKLVFLNEKGIPLPLLRDNATNAGSFTLTMAWISFNVCLIALIGKIAGYLGGIDYSNCLWLLGVTGGLHWGKSVTSTSKDGTTFSIEKKENENGKTQ